MQHCNIHPFLTTRWSVNKKKNRTKIKKFVKQKRMLYLCAVIPCKAHTETTFLTLKNVTHYE